MTNGDVERIADAVVEKLEANSLGDMKRDIASMAEDVAKIPLIEAEVREINQNVQDLREHAGIQGG